MHFPFALAGVLALLPQARNRYGLETIDTRQALEQSQARDSARRLLPLDSLIPGLSVDLRYATSRNFLHRPLYCGPARPYLRAPAALALRLVQQDLHPQGLGLRIWDAWRPYQATIAMWNAVRDARWVAPPRQGSVHNRAAAVDLTLVDLKSGRELDMGTDFDDFTPKAAPYADALLTAHQARNRRILREAMTRRGFRRVDTEWWHYNFPPKTRFEVLDLGFEDLRR